MHVFFHQVSVTHLAEHIWCNSRSIIIRHISSITCERWMSVIHHQFCLVNREMTLISRPQPSCNMRGECGKLFWTGIESRGESILEKIFTTRFVSPHWYWCFRNTSSSLSKLASVQASLPQTKSSPPSIYRRWFRGREGNRTTACWHLSSNTVNHVSFRRSWNSPRTSTFTNLMESILENRYFYDELGSKKSRWRKLISCLSQGSVLVPLRFNICTINKPRSNRDTSLHHLCRWPCSIAAQDDEFNDVEEGCFKCSRRFDSILQEELPLYKFIQHNSSEEFPPKWLERKYLDIFQIGTGRCKETLTKWCS